MIGVIALAGISIWNSIILLEYFEELVHKGMDLKDALIKAWVTRLKPIFLTSSTAIIWALMILWDPVWSWLAWSIIWWLSASAILTLILIPIFVYDNQTEHHKVR
jgi:multidrug efflux pump subunit AcrB